MKIKTCPLNLDQVVLAVMTYLMYFFCNLHCSVKIDALICQQWLFTDLGL